MRTPDLDTLGIDFFGFGTDGAGFFGHEWTTELLGAMNSRYNDGFTSASVDLSTDVYIGQGEQRHLHPWIFAAHRYWRGLGYFTEISKSTENGETTGSFLVSWENPDFNDSYPASKLWEVPGMAYTGTTTTYDINGWQARDAYLMQTRGNDLRRYNDRLTLDDIYKKLREVQVYGSTPSLVYFGPKGVFSTLNQNLPQSPPKASAELYKKRLSQTFSGVRQTLTDSGFSVVEVFPTQPNSAAYWDISGVPVDPTEPDPEP